MNIFEFVVEMTQTFLLTVLIINVSKLEHRTSFSDYLSNKRLYNLEHFVHGEKELDEVPLRDKDGLLIRKRNEDKGE